MNRIRWVGSCVAIGGAALLSGCVAGPGYGTYGYSDPYYVDPGPVVVPGPTVYIDGGGYYGGRPYYGRRGYDGDYRGPRGGYRQGYPHPPNAGPLPRGARPPVVGVPGRPRGEPPLAGSVMRPPPGVPAQTGPALADRP
ncbi:conserved exported hypothetical protein [Burkholderiales bacterium 8X]|nr:conserved exported hypothetical protein [Burkholderiales bacterium 8X]